MQAASPRPTRTAGCPCRMSPAGQSRVSGLGLTAVLSASRTRTARRGRGECRRERSITDVDGLCLGWRYGGADLRAARVSHDVCCATALFDRMRGHRISGPYPWFLSGQTCSYVRLNNSLHKARDSGIDCPSA